MQGGVVILFYVTIPGSCCCSPRSPGTSWVRCGSSGALPNAVTSTSPGLSQKVRLFGWRKQTKPHTAPVIWLQTRNDRHGDNIDQRFPTLLPVRNPWNKFSYPHEPLYMKTMKGHKELRKGRIIQLLLNCHENSFWKIARVWLRKTERLLLGPACWRF